MCNFKIEFKGTAAEAVARAKAGIEKAGGTFNGNTERGHFSIPSPSIAGNYTIEGQVVNIMITKKPFYIPCSAIEAKLRELIGKGEALTALVQRSSYPSGQQNLATANLNALEHRVSATGGCIKFLGVLEICFEISGEAVTLSVKLLGVTIGKVTLNPSNTCATVGGSAAGFKAEVKLCVNFRDLVLTISGEVCAPIVGCKKGETHIRL